MTLINKKLGTIPRSAVEQLKTILELLGDHGSLKLEAGDGSVKDIPVNDDISIAVATPNSLAYQFDGDNVTLKFQHRPLVKYKGSNILSKYIKSIGVRPDSIVLDMGIVKAHFEVEDE